MSKQNTTSPRRSFEIFGNLAAQLPVVSALYLLFQTYVTDRKPDGGGEAEAATLLQSYWKSRSLPGSRSSSRSGGGLDAEGQGLNALPRRSGSAQLPSDDPEVVRVRQTIERSLALLADPGAARRGASDTLHRDLDASIDPRRLMSETRCFAQNANLGEAEKLTVTQHSSQIGLSGVFADLSSIPMEHSADPKRYYNLSSALNMSTSFGEDDAAHPPAEVHDSLTGSQRNASGDKSDPRELRVEPGLGSAEQPRPSGAQSNEQFQVAPEVEPTSHETSKKLTTGPQQSLSGSHLPRSEKHERQELARGSRRSSDATSESGSGSGWRHPRPGSAHDSVRSASARVDLDPSDSGRVTLAR